MYYREVNPKLTIPADKKCKPNVNSAVGILFAKVAACENGKERLIYLTP